MLRDSTPRFVGPSVRWSVGLLVRQSVHPSVGKHKLKSGKMRISTPAHPSATDGRVSGLVVYKTRKLKDFISVIALAFIEQIKLHKTNLDRV